MTVLPVHQRLAELWTLHGKRELTAEEFKEIEHCLTVNANYCWEMAMLENMSLLASMTRDTAWQHEICAEIERVQHGQPKTRRKRTNDGD
jgi:hypothetical protein